MKSAVAAFLCGLSVLSFNAAFAERIPEDRLLCYSPEVNPRLTQMSALGRKIVDLRRASKVLYFFKLPDPLERSFALNANGRIVEKKGREFTRTGISLYKHEDGSLRVLHQRLPANKKTLRNAAETYQGTLSTLRQPNAEGQPTPVPFDFLGTRLYVVADEYYPPPYDLEKVRTGYESNPSALAALVYLELALIERDLGELERSDCTLEEGVRKLDLLDVDFREDVHFRRHLHERFNFARPECVLLFLAADAAAKTREVKLAEKYYSLLIERAPASPFAWECFGKVARLPGVDQDRIAQLENVLVETYPLVWGCRRETLQLDASEIKPTVSILLRAFGG